MELPYEVVPFTKEALSTSLTTSGADMYSVQAKHHVPYFEEYLAQLKAATILVERNYVDRDYLEDYSAYYVRSHRHYARFCSRLHFFSQAFSADDFYDHLNGGSTIVNPTSLQNGYLGFVVLKPLPRTIIGRTCIKTYPATPKKREYLTRHYPVNLFGTNLSVESIAYQEQDSVVAACASSAIWSALHSTGARFQHAIPSPVEITKAATSRTPYRSRHFPNKGLSAEQMADAIRSVGLEPLLIDAVNDEILKASIYAYQAASIPIILGFRLQSVGDAKEIGGHAATVLGYSLENSNHEVMAGEFPLKLTSSGISKLYVHDDQVGPFAKMRFPDSGMALGTSYPPNESYPQGLEAVPEIMLVPVYQTIRITFDDILRIVVGLNGLLNLVNLSTPIEWDIRLYASNKLKEELAEDKTLPVLTKAYILTSSLPKYIWRACLKYQAHTYEFVFDASDIDQGKLFECTIPYSDFIDEMFRQIAKNIVDDAVSSMQVRNILAHFRGA